MSQDTTKPKAGLEGVVATSSDICFIDGTNGRLVYRGYEIGDLVENSTFEEVAYLLWKGKLPTKPELAGLKAELAAQYKLPGYVLNVIKALPASTNTMDALRTAVSILGADDADLKNNSPENNWRRAVRLTAQFPAIVAAFHRLRNGQSIVEPDPSLSIAANFLYMANGTKPNDTITRVMDAALVLHAEHGMNASTFAARVTAATLCDMYGSVTAATAALKGPLHGGANQDVMEFLMTVNSPEEAAAKVREIISKPSDQRGKIPGFGHRVYKTFDPRAHFLRKMSKQLGEAAGNTKWYLMSEAIIPILRDEYTNSKGEQVALNPNVDFFSASAYYTMGIPLDLFTPIFAIARVTGWTAHIMEQHRNNRIIRPTDQYTGPLGLKVEPLDKRA
jgi:citrate synthase